MFALAAAAAVAALAQEKPDELRLRNGTVLLGRVVEVDRNTVVFRTEAGLREFRRSEVAAIFFEGVPQESPGETTPGYTCLPPGKVARVITYRQLTRNRVVDDGKFEPLVAKISADGSKIAYWAPKSGLFAINPDGTGQRQVWENAPDRNSVEGYWFELSPDGKAIYWQHRQSGPIYRVNSDGSDLKLLARQGAEYEIWRMRQGARRIYFGSRAFISSVDTEGRGDYQEIFNNQKLSRELEAEILLGEFDVSEDGTRIVLLLYSPREKRRQLFAANGDGSGLHLLVKTDFEPTKLSMSPDGRQVVFAKYAERLYTVNWDGTALRELPIPCWDANGSASQYNNRFSPDGNWFAYSGNEAGGGPILTRLDGMGRFEVVNAGRWDGMAKSILWGAYPLSYSADLRRFCFVNGYASGRPQQLVYGEINPRSADGIPLVSDIEFGPELSTNPQVPKYVGTIRAKVRPANGNVERVQFMLQPMCWKVADNPVKWDATRGWWSLRGTHLLTDDGKQGDKAAGDGVFSTDLFSPDAGDYRPQPGRYPLRIVAHDELNAAVVDLDGVDVRN